MVSIPTPAQVLLGADAVVHVWTSNPDGSLQVSVVWAIARGDEIVFGTQRHPLGLRDSPDSVVVWVAIDRISGVGPWIDESATQFSGA